MTATTGPRVLLVDDEPAIRRALRGLFEDEGLQVVAEATDGDQAVSAAVEHAPDVVLMDLRMPKLGGIEATRRIKQAQPGTEVVVLTAYDDAGLCHGVQQAGAFAVLVKGCPTQLVLDTIEQAWATHHQDGSPGP